MRMDKLTTKFQLAIGDAQSLALVRDHQFIEPAHLMIAMLDQEGSGIRAVLAQSGVNVNGLRSGLDQMLDSMASVEGNAGQIHVSSELSRLLNLTDKAAQKRGDQYIATEVFILALLEDKSNAVAELLSTNSMAGKILMMKALKTNDRHWINTRLI